MDYRQIVLKEPYHLSYPHVFRWQNDFYMTPETLGAGAIRLYRANPFPTRSEWVADLATGSLADPTPFSFEDHWWMFACGTPSTHDLLRLFNSAHRPRMAGKPRQPADPEQPPNGASRGACDAMGSRRNPFAQDCIPEYGSGVRAFLVDDFRQSPPREVELSHRVLSPDGQQVCANSGMHHVDPHEISPGDWIACVDGSTG